MCKICTGEIHEKNLILVKYLDVSYCLNLTSEKLQEILIQCKNLITLDCYYTSLTSLDLRNNINLSTLRCFDCTSLTNLDLRSNINLKELVCSSCISLTSLDLQNNINLKELVCSRCRSLTSLDLQNNINLTTLDCFFCISLTSLDLRNNIKLKDLGCSYCISLTSLRCVNLTTSQRSNCSWISQNKDFSSNLQRLIKLQKWYRRILLIKYMKSQEFIEWIYAPNNIGGSLYKKWLLKNLK